MSNERAKFEEWYNAQPFSGRLLWAAWQSRGVAALDACIDMAIRYDADIEGCDGDELIRYGEGIACCFRLAYIIKYGKFPPEGDAWSVEFAQMAKEAAIRSLAEGPTKKLTQYECDCGRRLLVEGVVIGKEHVANDIS